jgi:hypothetical protein
MSKTSGKTMVKVEVYDNESEPTEIIHGRLLGMVTNDQYHTMVKDKSLINRLSTVSTKTLSEVAELSDVLDMRMALVIKKRNDTIVSRKQIFFSGPLDMISAVFSPKSMTAIGKNGAFILINEYVTGVGESTV